MQERRENIFIAKFESFLIQKHGKELACEIMHSAYEKYTQISIENEANPPIAHEYTRERAYAGVAIFDALVKHGRDREEAVDLILLYYAWRSARFGKKIKKFLKVPLLYKIAPYFFRKFTNNMFSEEAGFERKIYPTPKNEVKFDMLTCPYLKLAERYDCKEIVRAYCYADIVCFGELHEKLVFERPKAMSYGDSCCVFRFAIKNKA